MSSEKKKTWSPSERDRASVFVIIACDTRKTACMHTVHWTDHNKNTEKNLRLTKLHFVEHGKIQIAIVYAQLNEQLSSKLPHMNGTYESILELELNKLFLFSKVLFY